MAATWMGSGKMAAPRAKRSELSHPHGSYPGSAVICLEAFERSSWGTPWRCMSALQYWKNLTAPKHCSQGRQPLQERAFSLPWSGPQGGATTKCRESLPPHFVPKTSLEAKKCSLRVSSYKRKLLIKNQAINQ